MMMISMISIIIILIVIFVIIIITTNSSIIFSVIGLILCMKMNLERDGKLDTSDNDINRKKRVYVKE